LHYIRQIVVKIVRFFPGLDLLWRMLTWDARKRITAAEALQHPFFHDMKQKVPEEEVGPLYPKSVCDFEFQAEPITAEEIWQRIQNELPCRDPNGLT